jgi:major membrane immunogen (membrane-anchored lipoprotein)
MRHVLPAGLIAAALMLGGCGHKDAAGGNATTSVALDNGASTGLDNGTASDITAADATIGAEGNMTMTEGPVVDTSTNEAAPEKPAKKKKAETDSEEAPASPAGNTAE